MRNLHHAVCMKLIIINMKFISFRIKQTIYLTVPGNSNKHAVMRRINKIIRLFCLFSQFFWSLNWFGGFRNKLGNKSKLKILSLFKFFNRCWIICCKDSISKWTQLTIWSYKRQCCITSIFEMSQRVISWCLFFSGLFDRSFRRLIWTSSLIWWIIRSVWWYLLCR